MVLEPQNFGEMKGEAVDFGHKTTTKKTRISRQTFEGTSIDALESLTRKFSFLCIIRFLVKSNASPSFDQVVRFQHHLNYAP